MTKANLRALSLLICFSATIAGCSSTMSRLPERSLTLNVPAEAKGKFLDQVADFSTTYKFEEKNAPTLSSRPNNTAIFLNRDDMEVLIANDAYASTNPFSYQVFFYHGHFKKSKAADITATADTFVSKMTQVSGVTVLSRDKAVPDMLPAGQDTSSGATSSSE